jgi:hypothetical protein
METFIISDSHWDLRDATGCGGNNPKDGNDPKAFT